MLIAKPVGGIIPALLLILSLAPCSTFAASDHDNALVATTQSRLQQDPALKFSPASWSTVSYSRKSLLKEKTTDTPAPQQLTDPAPATVWLLGAGALALALVARRNGMTGA